MFDTLHCLGVREVVGERQEIHRRLNGGELTCGT